MAKSFACDQPALVRDGNRSAGKGSLLDSCSEYAKWVCKAVVLIAEGAG